MGIVVFKQEGQDVGPAEEIGAYPPYEPEFLARITTNNARCGLCDLINMFAAVCDGKTLGKHIYSK
jgi:hypothetical protein